MNMSSNKHLHRYGLGILDALPTGAIFLTNYDQQWAVVRYVHISNTVC